MNLTSRFHSWESAQRRRKLAGPSLEIFGLWELPQSWENKKVSYHCDSISLKNVRLWTACTFSASFAISKCL